MPVAAPFPCAFVALGSGIVMAALRLATPPAAGATAVELAPRRGDDILRRAAAAKSAGANVAAFGGPVFCPVYGTRTAQRPGRGPVRSTGVEAATSTATVDAADGAEGRFDYVARPPVAAGNGAIRLFSYRNVCLESFGYVLPETVVTSVELERELAPVYERFGLHEGRLELMTGIRERRFWDEETLPSDASTRAGRSALERSGVSPGEIECLLHTSVSRDCLEPATASVVHDNLGLPARSVVYDISNACLGFLNGVLSLANMIELGQVKRGLIVAGESSRQLVRTTIEQLLRAPRLTRQEFKTAFASLTIGSGAVGLVMAHAEVSRTTHQLLGGVVGTATEHHHLCRGSADTGFSAQSEMSMRTDSETLLVGGCALAAETWRDFRRHLGWSNGDLGRVYTHQVGAAHRDKLYESVGLDPSRDFSTFPFLGNVGSASLPLTMAMGVEADPPPRGTNMAMLGIGSGLSCVMLGVRW